MFILFDKLDAVFALLPAAVRLGLYGLVTGALTMILYWLISPQRRLAALKQEASEARRAHRAYEGTSFHEICRLSWRAISPALMQVGLGLGPTLVAAAPVVLMMAWLESSYSHRFPRAGEPVTITTTPASAMEQLVQWAPTQSAGQAMPEGQCIVQWPAGSETARLIDAASGQELLRLPLERPTPTIGQPRWWHWLLEGGSGDHLPAGGALTSVKIDLPARRLWAIGPAWLSSWHATFMLALTIGALAAKFRFKIA